MDSEQHTAQKGSRELRRLYICLAIFLTALFFQALTGFGLIPAEGVQTLRELAGRAGEALARSELVEAFAEGFQSAAKDTEAFADSTAKASTSILSSTTVDVPAETTTTGLPLLTKQTDR